MDGIKKVDRYLSERTSKEYSLYSHRASYSLYQYLVSLGSKFPSKTIGVPSFICHAPIAAIIAAGWTPYFLDLGQESVVPSEAEIDTGLLNGVNVFLWVHMFGIAHESEIYRELTTSNDHIIIEDACLSFGTQVFGHSSGSHGHAALFSFGPGKQSDLSYGGAIYTDTEIITQRELCLPSNYPDEASYRNHFYSSIVELEQYKDRSNCKSLIAEYIPLLHGEFDQSKIQKFDADLLSRKKQDRTEKFFLYSELLGALDIDIYEEEGMDPWRFCFRIPLLTKEKQKNISETMRSEGVDISNWYWPAHYFLGKQQYLSANKLPNTEQRNNEIFQFWINDSISEGAIHSICKKFSQLI